MGRLKASGVAVRRTARIWRHQRSQKISPTAIPRSHTPIAIMEKLIPAVRVIARDEAPSAGLNGRLISSNTPENSGGAATGDSRQGSRAPMLTRSEKGTRNFNDAASQS